MAVKYIEGIGEEVEIEFSDVMAYLEEGEFNALEAENIYKAIEKSLDTELNIDDIEEYMESADVHESNLIFSIIKHDVDYSDMIPDMFDEFNHGIHDEMAIDKIKDYLSVNGVQSLAELIK